MKEHKHPLRATWRMMIARCHDEDSRAWGDYGGRGITVCERWREGDGEKSGFACFVEDVGDRPTPKHTLDRANNDLGYSKENCRWATASEQARNKRKPKARTNGYATSEPLMLDYPDPLSDPKGFQEKYRADLAKGKFGSFRPKGQRPDPCRKTEMALRLAEKIII